MIRIPDSVKKCVAFIGTELDGKRRYCGTGFFVTVSSKVFPEAKFLFLVTAKHVVAEITGNKFFVRVNLKDGQAADFNGLGNEKWWFHPDESKACDVAVFNLRIPPEVSSQLDFAQLPIETCLDDGKIKTLEIGEGDDVFAVGLFAHHHGTKKNNPIIRTGNIAMMPDEPVPTSKFGDMEVYLIESRSIGGLSGSPVFVLKQTVTNWAIHLLGLIHGHWDVDTNAIIDTHTSDKSGIKAGVNVGIAMVAPAKKIVETICQQPLADMWAKAEEKWIQEHSAEAGMDQK